MACEGVKTLTRFDRLVTLVVGMQMGIGLHGVLGSWVTWPVSALAVVFLVSNLVHTHRVKQEAIDDEP